MRREGLASIRGLAAVALIALSMGTAWAQAPAPKAAQEANAGPASAPQVVMPDAERIVLLIRTTLLTLNDAVQTGNFTVLRDRAAPGFRDANPAARLGALFNDLAARGVDLGAVAILAPELTEAPALDPKTGMLHLKGRFLGRPVRIDFDLLFLAVEGRWRVFGLSVQPVSTAPAPAVAAPTAPGQGGDKGTTTKGPPAKAAPAKK
jgi:hypothetical protein